MYVTKNVRRHKCTEVMWRDIHLHMYTYRSLSHQGCPYKDHIKCAKKWRRLRKLVARSEGGSWFLPPSVGDRRDDMWAEQIFYRHSAFK